MHSDMFEKMKMIVEECEKEQPAYSLNEKYVAMMLGIEKVISESEERILDSNTVISLAAMCLVVVKHIHDNKLGKIDKTNAN